MDIQPFFTEEEKKQFFSKYKQLLRHLYSFLKKEDLSKMKELMKRVVALDCYGRDKESHEENPVRYPGRYLCKRVLTGYVPGRSSGTLPGYEKACFRASV